MQKGGKIVYTSLEDFTSSKVSVKKDNIYWIK